MNIVRDLLLAIIFTAFFFIVSASADDAPLELLSGGVCPMLGPGERIRMDSEEVNIRLGDKSYIVDATFHLTNFGKTKTILVGFPKKGLGYLGEFKKVADFIKFETWVNGEPVQFTEEGGASSLEATDLTLPQMLAGLKSGDAANLAAKDIRWLVKRVNFPGGKTTTTRVRYEAPYNRTKYETPAATGVLCGFAHYIYGSGRFWHGNIGKATFVVESARTQETSPRVVMPDKASEKRVSETATAYTLTDIEPREDAEVTIYLCPPE